LVVIRWPAGVQEKQTKDSENMNKVPEPQGRTIDQSHEDRLRHCAELGQVVPVDKKRCREHLEAMATQLLREARGAQ
jgi:hypothetical protein